MKNRYVDKSVASPDNAVFRALLECLTTKGIKKHGLFFLSGEKTVTDVINRHPSKIRNLIVCSDLHLDADEQPISPALAELLERAREAHSQVAILAFTKPLFDQLDLFGTHAPLLVLNSWSIDDAPLTTPPRGLELLCALSDPANLGALIRSAAAFGATRLVLLKESASPFHAKAVRAAAGATFEIGFARGPSIRELDSELIALDMAGESLAGFAWPRNARLLLGEEGQGIPPTARAKTVSIPISGKIESLNATVAASIALYSYRNAHPQP